MNLRKAIIDYRHKEEMLPIVKEIGADKEKFALAIEMMLSKEILEQQKAAWVVMHSAEKHPELIKPHIHRIIKNLNTPGLHDAVKRATLRSLDLIAIPEKHWGLLVEICFEYLASHEPTGVKIFAMAILQTITKELPELKNELRLVLEDQLPYGTAGFKNRAGKILAALDN